jgi:hypothetical protein
MDFGDGQFAAETPQHLTQEAQAQRPAVLAPHAAGKLQGKIIILGRLAHQGVEIGIVVAEFDAQIRILPGENGETVSPGQVAFPAHGALGHEAQQVFGCELDTPGPANTRVGETPPEGPHGDGFQMVRHDLVTGGQAVFDAAP